MGAHLFSGTQAAADEGFEARVVEDINRAKECLYEEVERREYVPTLVSRDGLSEFYDECLRAMVFGYTKACVYKAAQAAITCLRQIRKDQLNKDIQGCCARTEKCIETYSRRLENAPDSLRWFHIDVLLANLLAFSEFVVRETKDDNLKKEMRGLFFRVGHLRMVLPQRIEWDERFGSEQLTAIKIGGTPRQEGSANFLEICLFRVVYASRATFVKNGDRTVKIDVDSLAGLLRVQCVRDFYAACDGFISGRDSNPRKFVELAKAVVVSLGLSGDLRKECESLVFPKNSFDDFLAGERSRCLFLFGRVLGGMVSFLNLLLEEESAREDAKLLRAEIRSFRLLLLALLALHTLKAGQKIHGMGIWAKVLAVLRPSMNY